MRGREGVARRGQKPLGRSPGASFLSPLSLAIQRKGARGWRGRAAPRGVGWAPLRSALRPRQPHVNDAARRVVVKRMREEHFKHALPVLWAVRFLCGWPARRFFCPWWAPAGCGAFGRGPVRATPATPVCGLRGRKGVARRRQKPRDVARGELSFPPFFGDPKKGGAGAAGARSPRGKAWAFLRLALRPWQDLHERFGTVRAGTRGWAGNSRPAPTAPPLPRLQL